MAKKAGDIKEVIYKPGMDPDHVIKEETEEETFDLKSLIDRYKEIEGEWNGITDYRKEEPDQETLDWWNAHHGPIVEAEEEKVIGKAKKLYDKLIPIFQAGLIPKKYNKELLRLKNFVESH